MGINNTCSPFGTSQQAFPRSHRRSRPRAALGNRRRQVPLSWGSAGGRCLHPAGTAVRGLTERGERSGHPRRGLGFGSRYRRESGSSSRGQGVGERAGGRACAVRVRVQTDERARIPNFLGHRDEGFGEKTVSGFGPDHLLLGPRVRVLFLPPEQRPPRHRLCARQPQVSRLGSGAPETACSVSPRCTPSAWAMLRGTLHLSVRGGSSGALCAWAALGHDWPRQRRVDTEALHPGDK